MKRFSNWRGPSLIIDKIITSRWVRWTWSGLSKVEYSSVLREYRPGDAETVREMFEGRYLLAAKLVDTNRVSPFSAKIDHKLWHDELHGFSWLRHFEEARNSQQREFSRTLVLDWIGRNSEYDENTWGLAISSKRVMNWLRHFSLLCDGASEKQIKTISVSISMQAQAAKLRGPYAPDRFDELMAMMLGVAIALCDGSTNAQIDILVGRLCKKLQWQLFDNGFYRSKNGADQLALLEELVSIRLTLSQKSGELSRELGAILDQMHLALDAITLNTGEPAYFNGCGQLPTELIFAIQNQGKQRLENNGCFGGYGVVELGKGYVVMDSGIIPLAPYAKNAHASALAIEFSHERDLIFGSCGPAPEELKESKDLFRQSSAHSGPNIDDMSSARFGAGGILLAEGQKPQIMVKQGEAEIVASCSAYQDRLGIKIERRVTLLGEGETLVGQDKLVASGIRKNFSGTFIQRFHLAPGARAQKSNTDELIVIYLKSGAMWTFLWEGARVKIEESVRQSAHIGYHRTEQIVLESDVVGNREIENELEVSWIFTRQ